MEFRYILTEQIKKFIEKSELVNIKIGCSDSEVIKVNKENGVYYIKMAKKGLLTQEYNALKWLDGKLKVPKVVLFDDETDVEFLITEAINGVMVCSERYLADPELAIKIIGEAFKSISSIDISDCPFNVSTEYKLSLIEKNLKDGLILEENITPEILKKFGSKENILKYLKENKFDEELCFSHGDASLPNIFANNDEFAGFIDVGECGIADKWFDLAICEKSIKRNFGEDYIHKFYNELNIAPDRKKIDYYLLIMELYL